MDPATDGDLERVVLDHGDLHAEVLLQGGQCWRFSDAGGERLYQSPATAWRVGEPVRGGVPLCWPWLGRHPEHPEWGMHGPLRTRPFVLVDRVERSAAMAVKLQAELDADLPGVCSPCRITVAYRFAPAHLRCTWTVQNRGSIAQPSAGALHTYLRGDIQHARVTGLSGCAWHGPDGSDAAGIVDGPIDDLVGTTCTVHDGTERRQPVLHLGDHRCTLDRQGSRSLVIWNPGPDHGIADLPADAWQDFCCLETVNSDQDARTIAPGGEHVMVADYRWSTAVSTRIDPPVA